MRLVDADELIRKLETKIEECNKVVQEPGGLFSGNLSTGILDISDACLGLSDIVDKRSHCTFAVTLLKAAPTAECSDRWNLCEGAKDLPPSGTACFVTVECNGEKSVCISTFDHGTGWSNLEHGERVVSWMRLPEAYDGWERWALL